MQLSTLLLFAAGGIDPSHPGFYIAGQEITSGNHIAQWVTDVERQPCDNDDECASGEFCEGGECVPVIE